MNKFESDRVIEFTPPDGEFELMSYRLTKNLKPLIFVEVESSQKTTTTIEYTVTAKSNYKLKSIAKNVEISIPVPNDLKNPTFKTGNGNVTYLPDKDCAMWIINNFPGQSSVMLTLKFNVPFNRNENSNQHLKKPITLKFEIPSFTISGIQVRYLKITEKSGYQSYPYVKYLTRNGDYQIRMV